MPQSLRIEYPVSQTKGALRHLGSPRFIGRHHQKTCRRLVDGSVMAVDALGIHESAAESGELLRSTKGLLPGTPHIATVTGDVFFVVDSELRVWRRGSERIVPVCALPGTSRISIAPDGTHVAVDVASKVTVVRCADGAVVASLDYPYGESFELAAGARWVLFYQDIPVQSGSGWLEYVTVSLDGRQVETGNAFGDGARVYVSTDGLSAIPESNPLTPPPVDFYTWWSEPAEPLALDPEGRRALASHTVVWKAGALVYDIRERGIQAIGEGGDCDRVQALAYSGDQALCFWNSGRLEVHDLRGGSPKVHAIAERSRRLGAFARQGDWFACFSTGRLGTRLEVFAGGDFAAPQERTLPPNVHPKCLAVLADGRVLGATSLNLYTVSAEGAQSLKLPVECDPRQIACSDDGEVIVVRAGTHYHWADPCGPVHLIDRGAATLLLPGDTLVTAVWSVAVQPDGRRFAVSRMDGVMVYNARPLREMFTLPCKPAVALAISADGRRLFARHLDTTLTVWELP